MQAQGLSKVYHACALALAAKEKGGKFLSPLRSSMQCFFYFTWQARQTALPLFDWRRNGALAGSCTLWHEPHCTVPPKSTIEPVGAARRPAVPSAVWEVA